MFQNNIVKILEKFNKSNLLKICFQATCPTDFCIIYFIFTTEKVKIFDLLKNKWQE